MKMEQLSFMVGCKWVAWWTSGDKFVYVTVVKMEGREGELMRRHTPLRSSLTGNYLGWS